MTSNHGVFPSFGEGEAGDIPEARTIRHLAWNSDVERNGTETENYSESFAVAAMA